MSHWPDRAHTRVDEGLRYPNGESIRCYDKVLLTNEADPTYNGWFRNNVHRVLQSSQWSRDRVIVRHLSTRILCEVSCQRVILAPKCLLDGSATIGGKEYTISAVQLEGLGRDQIVGVRYRRNSHHRWREDRVVQIEDGHFEWTADYGEEPSDEDEVVEESSSERHDTEYSDDEPLGPNDEQPNFNLSLPPTNQFPAVGLSRGLLLPPVTGSFSLRDVNKQIRGEVAGVLKFSSGVLILDIATSTKTRQRGGIQS
ncbi:uncharacterized protein AB675_2054 [Cyphellophora attinorum]|uniref:Uncharacterized protein n=1 Tax=Cyphellophora attinorum TaxID=1664694 RepID=A0A0N1P064_9EURO|nr:uncharacterized protein AB675_2054 [Phialophora attinorum]KPI42754.1 hypothetical protein AB675_2054 [Phialophora attinorum]